MSKQVERENPAKDLVTSHIRRRVSVINEATVFSSESLLAQSHGNITVKDHVRHFAQVAEACYKLGIDAPIWDAKVKEVKDAKKAEAMETGDVMTAVEIDKYYMEYLFDTGRFDEAVEFALHITDGYAVPHPDEVPLEKGMGMNNFMEHQRLAMQHRHFSREKDHIMGEISGKFIRRGDLERAKQVASNINLNSLSGYMYFACLFDHYTENSDIEGIKGFANEMEGRMATLQKVMDDGERDEYIEADMTFRTFRALSDQCKEYLAKQEMENGQLDTALELLKATEVPSIKAQRLTNLAEELVKQERTADARKVSIIVLDFIHENSSYKEDRSRSESGRHSAIGDISFSEAKIEDEPEKDFNPYNTVEERIRLAWVLGTKEEFKDLVTRCIEGDDQDNKYSLVELIKISSSPKYLWGHMLELYVSLKDTDTLKELVEEGCELYPESADYYKTLLAQVSPEEEIDWDKREQAILEMTDPKGRAVQYASFVFDRFDEGNESITEWNKHIEKLRKLEDQALAIDKGEEEDGDWDLSELDEVDDSETDEAEEDENVTTVVSSGSFSFGFMSKDEEDKFWRRSSGVMANIAKLALKKGNFDVFGQILNDPRMENYMAVTLMKEAADWANGSELKSWY